MTAPKVVDASAVAALLFDELAANAVAVELEGAALVAPSLIIFELANVCLVKCRRHPHEAEALITALRLFERLGVQIVPVDQEAVVRLAQDTGLSAYDASYLWLARRFEANLVTLDKRLAAARVER
ncbi:MAG: type II toxin-antitoxin system VapC family toxin [Pseudomonadota bacterium]